MTVNPHVAINPCKPGIPEHTLGPCDGGVATCQLHQSFLMLRSGNSWILRNARKTHHEHGLLNNTFIRIN